MSIVVNVNGESINYPQTSDTNWGDEATDFAVQTSSAFAKVGLSTGTTVDIPGTLDVTGATTLDSTLTVAGTANLNGNTTIAGTLNVTGALTAPIAASNISSGQLSSARMPIGSIIQVVSANDTGVVTISSTSFVSANLAATITPTSASSKILVILNAGVYVFGNSSSSGRNHNLEIVKSLPSANTQIHLIDFSNATVNAAGTFGYSYVACGLILDSPSTTSAITYTFRANIASECRLELHRGSSNSSIILMEIVA